MIANHVQHVIALPSYFHLVKGRGEPGSRLVLASHYASREGGRRRGLRGGKEGERKEGVSKSE